MIARSCMSSSPRSCEQSSLAMCGGILHLSVSYPLREVESRGALSTKRVNLTCPYVVDSSLGSSP